MDPIPQNPYEGPQTTETAKRMNEGRRPNVMSWVVGILVAIPAFAIGFFITCLGTIFAADAFISNPPFPWLVFVWIAGGLVCGGLAFWLIRKVMVTK